MHIKQTQEKILSKFAVLKVNVYRNSPRTNKRKVWLGNGESEFITNDLLVKLQNYEQLFG